MRPPAVVSETAIFSLNPVAGAAIGTGLLLAILNRPKAYQIRPEELQEEQDKHKVSIKPIVTPNMAGAVVHGSF